MSEVPLRDLPPEEFKEAVLGLVDFFREKKVDPSDIDIRDIGSTAAAMFLMSEAVEMNAGSYKLSVKGYTRSGEDHGDWVVHVYKVTPEHRIVKRVQSFFSNLWDRLRRRKIETGEVADIFKMKLTKLTIVIDQPENKQ